jgi:hypothetical protein
LVTAVAAVLTEEFCKTQVVAAPSPYYNRPDPRINDPVFHPKFEPARNIVLPPGVTYSDFPGPETRALLEGDQNR